MSENWATWRCLGCGYVAWRFQGDKEPRTCPHKGCQTRYVATRLYDQRNTIPSNDAPPGVSIDPLKALESVTKARKGERL